MNWVGLCGVPNGESAFRLSPGEMPGFERRRNAGLRYGSLSPRQPFEAGGGAVEEILVTRQAAGGVVLPEGQVDQPAGSAPGSAAP